MPAYCETAPPPPVAFKQQNEETTRDGHPAPPTATAATFDMQISISR